MTLLFLTGAAFAQTVPTPRDAPPPPASAQGAPAGQEPVGRSARREGPKWGAHLDLEGKAGNKRNIGEADVFVPLWQNDDTLVFGNVRTRLDDDSSKEGNFGAGVRHMLESGWNIGGYGYFDRRKATYGSYFNQWTVGAEALSVDWDFRVNAYIPEGRRSHQVDSLNTAEISGTSVVFRGGEERSMRGFDGEIGWRVPVFDLDVGRALRIYGGAYRFYADGVDPVQGPRARAELTFDEVPGLWEGSRLTLGAEAQHDGPRGGQVFAVARLRIPLQVFGESRSNLTPMERRMTDPTVRDVDVVSQAGALGAPETVTQTAGGQTISVLDSGSTTGANLPTAVANAGANSTVILSGTFATTAQINMQAGQTLMGAGTLTVRSASGRTASLTTANATVTMTTGGNGNTVEAINDNVTITGLTLGISGANAFAIRSTGNNVTISNNTLSSSSSSTVTFNAVGIRIVSGSATITGNRVTASGGERAIALWVGNIADATVSGNALSASGGDIADWHTFLQSAIIHAGSTGNTLSATNVGVCQTDNGGSGFVGYTNAANCLAGP